LVGRKDVGGEIFGGESAKLESLGKECEGMGFGIGRWWKMKMVGKKLESEGKGQVAIQNCTNEMESERKYR
jgi:hypothetical protein